MKQVQVKKAGEWVHSCEPMVGWICPFWQPKMRGIYPLQALLINRLNVEKKTLLYFLITQAFLSFF